MISWFAILFCRSGAVAAERSVRCPGPGNEFLTSTLNDSGMPASIVLALDDGLVHLGAALTSSDLTVSISCST